MAQAVDLFMTYQFIKRLATPFDETEAFNLGLIDEKGKRLKKAKTSDEKAAMTPFDRMIFNMKRLLNRLPGGESKIKTYAAAILLLREEQDHTYKNLLEEIDKLNKSSAKSLKDIREDAPANATGAGVVGTGDNPVHRSNRGVTKIGQKGNRKKMGRYISGVQFLKKRMSANNVTKNTA